MTCDELEIAIEQRHRGLLPEVAAVQLDRHLATCESCQAYEVTTHSVDESLHRAGRAAIQESDRAAIGARVTEIVRRRGRRIVRTILEQIVLVAYVVWMSTAMAPSARHTLPAAILGLLVIGPLAWGAITRESREAEQIARGRGDILAWWRDHLDKQLASLSRQRWMWPVFSFVIASVLWSRHRRGTEWQLAAQVVGLTAWTIAVSIAAARSVEQLRRERAGLDG